MILSRRSFLKVAGLTTVAVAGASMFTGCTAAVTTPIEYVAAHGLENDDDFKKLLETLNKNLSTKSVLGGSDLHKDGKKNQEYITNLLGGLSISIKALKDVKVESAELSEKKNEDGKVTGFYIKAVLTKQQS